MISGNWVHDLLTRSSKARHWLAVPILCAAALARLPFGRKNDFAFAVLRKIDECRLQFAAVIDQHRIGIDHLQHGRVTRPQSIRKIIGIIADAKIAEGIGHIVHTRFRRRTHRHQVARLLQPPTHRLRPCAITGEVPEAFLAERCPLPYAIWSIDDDRCRRHAVIKRRRIDEWLDRRTWLTLRLRRAVKAGNAIIKTALDRQNAAIHWVLHHHAAADFWNAAHGVAIRTIGRDSDNIAGFHRRWSAV